MDHFASVEKEAYETTRNMISTLNFELPEEDEAGVEEPLHSVEELMGLAPQDYDHSLEVKLVSSTHTLKPTVTSHGDVLELQLFCNLFFCSFFLVRS